MINDTKAFSLGMLVVPLALLGLSVVFASQVTTPSTFVGGTAAVAAEVNANFAVHEAAINDNDSRLDALEQTPAAVPSFYAAVSLSNLVLSPSQTIVCDTESHDDGGVYNDQSGAFTAPRDGVYHFVFNCYPTAGAAGVRMEKNGSVSLGGLVCAAGVQANLAVTVKLVQGDVVLMRTTAGLSLQGTQGSPSDAYTTFCGFLIQNR